MKEDPARTVMVLFEEATADSESGYHVVLTESKGHCDEVSHGFGRTIALAAEVALSTATGKIGESPLALSSTVGIPH